MPFGVKMRKVLQTLGIGAGVLLVCFVISFYYFLQVLGGLGDRVATPFPFPTPCANVGRPLSILSGQRIPISSENAAQAELLLRLNASPYDRSQRINQIVWSHDNRWLLAVKPNWVIFNLETGSSLSVDDPVTEAAFAPNDLRFALGTRDGVAIYELSHFYRDPSINIPGRMVSSISYSPDGETLAIASSDQTIKLYTLSKITPQPTTRAQQNWLVPAIANSVIYSPDGKVIAAGLRNGLIQIWDVAQGNPTTFLTGSASVNSISFSGDGEWLAAGLDDHSIQIWDRRIGKSQQRLQGHTAPVVSVAFNHDGRVLASGSKDGSVRLWDLRAGHEAQIFHDPSREVTSVTFSGDNSMLAASYTDGSIRVWGIAQGHVVRGVDGHTQRVNGLSFSPDGKILASYSEDGTIKLWDVETTRELHTLGTPADPKEFTRAIQAGVFSTDGRQFTSVARSGLWQVWDARSGAELSRTERTWNLVHGAQLTEDGRLLGAYGSDAVVDVKSGEMLFDADAFAPMPDGTIPVNLTFSPDGTKLAIGTEASGSDAPVIVNVVDTVGRRKLYTLQGHKGAIQGLAFSREGKMLATSGYRETRLWNAQTGIEIASFEGVSGAPLDFSPDGQTLAIGGGYYHIAQLLDVNEKCQRIFLNIPNQGATALHYSPDGAILAIGTSDGAVQFWHVK